MMDIERDTQRDPQRDRATEAAGQRPEWKHRDTRSEMETNRCQDRD